jgi:uncharacterized protein
LGLFSPANFPLPKPIKPTHMSDRLKTPGVYIEELNAFPNSVVQVPTAIPAFIGYTPKADYQGKSYFFTPVFIQSMADFMAFFTYPKDLINKVEPQPYSPSYYLSRQKTKPVKGTSYSFNGDHYTIEPDPDTIYYLYNSVKLFFQQGGTEAYIVSVGSYGPPSGWPIQAGEKMTNANVLLADLQKGLKAIRLQQDVTMYVFPESTLLSDTDNGKLMQDTLMQCEDMKTAIAIFDVKGGHEPDPVSWTSDIERFRNNTGNRGLPYGAVYYPFLKTGIVSGDQISYANLNGGNLSILEEVLNPPSAPNPVAASILSSIGSNGLSVNQNQQALLIASKTYSEIIKIVLEKINIMPSAGIMAGLYASVDNSQGVWKAPANISPTGVTDVTIRINDQEQENLNVTLDGKSINAFRVFIGQGVLVWGARTLDGNSQDWRYISVRRTVTMMEQSIKLAVQTFVFEPNDANTWTLVKGMIENFLTNLWQQGGLAGSKPDDAFFVHVGLGSSMTSQDILDGVLRVMVGVAVLRPGEFIVLEIVQVMGKG